MKAYFDTSVLVAYYCPEPLSDLAEASLRGIEPVISNLVEVEFFSALTRKVQERSMKRADAGEIGRKFTEHLTAGNYVRIPVASTHFQQSRDWLSALSNGLRTLDALHLAIAHAEKFRLITADARLHLNALKRGVACKLLAVELD